MVKRILFAVLMVALVAMPAFAAVQSVKVSGSLDSTWLVREQFDLGSGNDTQKEFYQNLLITQAIVRIDADLTDNVSVVTQLINERAWDEEDLTNTADSTDIDLNLAYVQLREFLYSPLSVTVGRQHLMYGNQLIIGSGPNNATGDGGLANVAEDLTKRAAFDAVKMVLDYNPLTIDVFASKVDANRLAGPEAGNSKDDVNVYGVNANWKLGDERNTAVEGYFFAKTDGSLQNNNQGKKADSIYTPGLRVVSNPFENFSTSAEVAWQKGNKASASTGNTKGQNMQRDAMAAQVTGAYSIPVEKIKKYSPVVSGSYTYASGDQNPADIQDVASWPASQEKYTAWDPMFENQAGGTIFNTLFDLTNCHIYNIALQVSPLEDITAKISWWSLFMDKKIDEADSDGTTTLLNLKQPDGDSFYPTTVRDEKQLGNELDVDLTYNYTDDVTLGFSTGMFFPGQVFFDNADDVAKQFITKVGVNW